nr:hypothetical protein DM860_000930 [Ipomoea batatas]GMC88588.1 hypothetical protein DM860_000930 [Ipomoea batatas]
MELREKERFIRKKRVFPGDWGLSYTYTVRKYCFLFFCNDKKRAEEKRGRLHIFGYFSVTELFLSRALPVADRLPECLTSVQGVRRLATWLLNSVSFICQSKDVKANLPEKTNPLGILLLIGAPSASIDIC